MKVIPEFNYLKPEICTVYCDALKQLNSNILESFLSSNLRDDVERTHLFNGRYENIYFNKQVIQTLALFETLSCQYARRILDVDNISMGYWFNYMPPGAITTAHNHDDDKELLSAVYYVSVPENSGNIVLFIENDNVEILPTAGSFIFFKPDIVHEVTENKSEEARLSIGINFGQSFKL